MSSPLCDLPQPAFAVSNLIAFVNINELGSGAERYQHLAQAVGLIGTTQGLGG